MSQVSLATDYELNFRSIVSLFFQLFKGKMFKCVGDLANVKTKEDCLSRPGNQWINSQYNFDNLGQALMALFVLSSKDGWVSIMYTGIDAVGVDKQPIENYNEWMLLYFISFLLLVGFFVLNMFVGVVIVHNVHMFCTEMLLEVADVTLHLLVHSFDLMMR